MYMTTKSRYINTITLSLLALTLTSGSFLISSNSSASDSGVDNVSITIPVTCTMVGTGMNSHTATIENGTYRGDDVNGIGIGETTLKAYCNDTSGFSIYAIGYTNEEYGNTVLKSTTLGDTYNIITGTNTGPVGTEDISNWSMKLKAVSGTYTPTIENGFSNYSNVPTTYTKVATKSSGTDMGSNAEGSSIKSTYAAYISKTQPSDTYEGKVKYTLVHPASEEPAQPLPAEPGKIVYHPNTSSVQGQIGDQSASNNASVDLWASNFKRTGYGFAGWNTAYDYSGTYYGPNQTITAPADVETNGLSLYAVWIKSQGTIQNWDGCDSLAQGATTALTDERDGNTYAVAKLADGKCWTIENLRLADKDSSNNDIELSSTNTHNPSLPLTNIYDSSTTSYHLSPTSSLDYDATTAPEGWCTTNSAACDDQSRLRTDNTTLFTDNTSSNYSTSNNVYSYGNYYNWYSATAGHGKYGSSYGSGYTSPGDICPAGWHLPTGGSATAEFGALDVAMGGTGAYQSTAEASNRWRSYPNNFVYSGYVDGSSVNGRGAYGFYWSSSANYSNLAYNLYFYSSYVYPGTYRSIKYYGRMARCVAGV
ncbi:hypothetical protein IKF87_00660 [Candidatus Saccharibacteria bacterium]|nr:hypothetical protein [Candidatus Saccharibacteria bacterium]